MAAVPPGTGLMIMANDHVEVFDNDIHDNQTANCSIISYIATQRPYDDDPPSAPSRQCPTINAEACGLRAVLHTLAPG